MIQLLHDPANGPLPTVLTRHTKPTITDFRNQPAWPAPGCGHCGAHVSDHVWQIVNPNLSEQGGVIDCGVTR